MRKKMLRSLLTLCIATATISAANAQSPIFVEPQGWSLGVTYGLADLWGDVGTQSPIDHYTNKTYWQKPCFMGGLFGRYTIHPALGLRMGLSYGTIYATDKWNKDLAADAMYTSDDAYQRYLRNQDIKDNVWEGSLMLEFLPLRLNLNGKVARKRFQPVLFAGVAGFHFKPFGSYVDPTSKSERMMSIKDLNLEGAGMPYPGAPPKLSYWQMAIPLGIGVRWDIGEHLNLGVDYIYRYTMTNSLDMVAYNYVDPSYYQATLTPNQAAAAISVQDKSWVIDEHAKHTPGEARGNSSINDGYSTISVSFYYKIKTRKYPWWR